LSTGNVGIDGGESIDPVSTAVTKKACEARKTPFSAIQSSMATTSDQSHSVSAIDMDSFIDSVANTSQPDQSANCFQCDLSHK